MIIVIVIGVVVVLGLLWLWATYNGLVKTNVRVDEAWSDINVQLKRRLDLIPNLVRTVKGYAKHEAEVLENVAKERASVVKGDASVQETAAAENALTGALKSVFAVAESNPDLKANQNFLQLQDELVDTEDKIQASRRFYNGAARELNIKVKTFPTNLFAKARLFSTRVFETEDQAAAEKPVEVSF